MENMFTQSYWSILALLVVLFPLFSFVFVSFGKSGKGAMLSITNLGLSFLGSIFLFLQVWNKTPLHVQVDWFTIGTVHFAAGILLNNLSVLMLLLVSGIALLVHIYSVEYMKGDAYLHRYWAYLGLFCFSMLGLVIADNLLIVYMLWELVGFSSYLLIGFWFTKETAALASKKAFIINRIGDLGFLTGLMILYSQFRTLDIQLLLGDGGLISSSHIVDGFWIIGEHKIPAIWLTVSGLAFLFGACAKSAQFPLHTWLPDAMEGPTSVSSLIHAATMVAAGIFLLVRISPLFDETVLSVITIVGTFTAFMAATIALTQNDIKRILAYSTISQLGYMMLSIGVGATSESIFHLTTHAFFKCLLFLAAGSVIHSLHHYKDHHQLDFDHQDIRNMGGLKKYMPITFWTMWLASLALIGFPLSSGYLSKDAILLKAFEWSDDKSGIANLVPYLAVITSWLTTFYIGRLIFKVFFGESRLPIKDGASVDIHDGSKFINIPLLILGLCSLFPLF
ncbi:MAG: proton-translocating NADH-quinone oxidoreductase, chain, partial [Daejeonella sp.]|nr:proton-translocating NADH-quinone oxidoreductase, chain [Daejeonella sp.]